MDALIKANLNIVAVVTSLDKPSGRNLQVQQSPVKQYAIKTGIPVLQPSNMKSTEFVEELKSYKADIQIVVAFRMMPEIVWNMPPMGTINLHGSLLPKYRGAAPINWAIINGETITGVTCFKLKHEIDTGNILSQKEIPILETDNVGTLHDKMMIIGASVLTETIIKVFKNEVKECDQIETDVTHAPKLFKHNTIIDWNQTCKQIYNFVRGLDPYPSAYTYLGSKFLKVFKTHYVIEKHNEIVGYSDTDNRTYMRFACLDGWLYFDDVQLEGKKRLPINEFLNGFKIKNET